MADRTNGPDFILSSRQQHPLGRKRWASLLPWLKTPWIRATLPATSFGSMRIQPHHEWLPSQHACTYWITQNSFCSSIWLWFICCMNFPGLESIPWFSHPLMAIEISPGRMSHNAKRSEVTHEPFTDFDLQAYAGQQCLPHKQWWFMEAQQDRNSPWASPFPLCPHTSPPSGQPPLAFLNYSII